MSGEGRVQSLDGQIAVRDALRVLLNRVYLDAEGKRPLSPWEIDLLDEIDQWWQAQCVIAPARGQS